MRVEELQTSIFLLYPYILQLNTMLRPLNYFIIDCTSIVKYIRQLYDMARIMLNEICQGVMLKILQELLFSQESRSFLNLYLYIIFDLTCNYSWHIR